MQIVYDPCPRQEDLQILSSGIILHAKIKKNHNDIQFFAFFIRDENHQIHGGLNGCNLYGCLHIDQLWVEESLRGMSYGTRLVSLAEKFGKEHGCTFATVNTMDWEALSFYKKLGYKIEFERHGYDKKSIFYFLRKDF